MSTPKKSKSSSKAKVNKSAARSKSKGGKANKTSGSSLSLKQRFQEEWVEKYPILVFLGIFALIMIVFYIFYLTPLYSDYVLAPWTRLNAWIGAGILSIFGFGTSSMGDTISSSDFTISVKQGCDAIEPTVLFIAGVLAFPAPWRNKWIGLPVGIAFLLAVNFIRILSLYLVGIWWPDGFEFMHIDFWQVLFILLAVLAWGYWIRWSSKKSKNAPGEPTDPTPSPANV